MLYLIQFIRDFGWKAFLVVLLEHEIHNLPQNQEGGMAMAKVKQYTLDGRPVRQYLTTEGRTITREEVERFLTNYETLDRAEGTFQFYRRKMKKFYEDLPEDKTVRHGTLEKWQEKLLQDGYAPSTVNPFRCERFYGIHRTPGVSIGGAAAGGK